MSTQATTPPPGGRRFPLTPAIRHGDTIYCSGQVPVVDGAIVSDDIREQALQTLKNVQRVVEGAGGSRETILKCTCYLRDASYFAPFNEVYQEFFASSPRFPARTTLIATPPNPKALVEIEAIAAVATTE